ncbi:hypothetical protein [Ruixingdingia sedimenti]|uniref:Uncharacterized protein n=1 Tax=Ruixingdingia sedimenti TaxID=3073604 RepID=A0ABU1FC35_9RHOB|nr:hypothetical protein [Xinfangfangia sp. LG-4]MDR5654426.1 hypothetical protein [Xinfangfangia sp. LG-4]
MRATLRTNPRRKPRMQPQEEEFSCNLNPLQAPRRTPRPRCCTAADFCLRRRGMAGICHRPRCRWRQGGRGVTLGPAAMSPHRKEKPMKGIIAWLLGVPIVVIILLYVTGIF